MGNEKKSNTEPDKDSLLEASLFGKVEGIEMAGAASYTPVGQKGTDMGEAATTWIAILHEFKGGIR